MCSQRMTTGLYQYQCIRQHTSAPACGRSRVCGASKARYLVTAEILWSGQPQKAISVRFFALSLGCLPSLFFSLFSDVYSSFLSPLFPRMFTFSSFFFSLGCLFSFFSFNKIRKKIGNKAFFLFFFSSVRSQSSNNERDYRICEDIVMTLYCSVLYCTAVCVWPRGTQSQERLGTGPSLPLAAGTGD